MRTYLAASVVIASISCASTPSHTADPVPSATLTVEPILDPPAPALADMTAVAPAIAVPATAPAPAPTTAPYASARSVEFVRNTVLYKAPSVDAEKVGIIRKDARAAVLTTATGTSGCDAGTWIEIAPRGWACETAVIPSTEAPSTATAPALGDFVADDRPLVPGVYGTVRGKHGTVRAFASVAEARSGDGGRALVGTTSVRATGSVTIAGRRYWRTAQGLIDAKSIARFSPSSFHGVVIEPGAAMPAWVRSHHDPREAVTARTTPSARGDRAGQLAARTVVTILETSGDGRFVRVGDDQWVARDDLRVATLAEPPPGTAVDERWFDVDLDEQVLVAYEGERPVYATLVSTGKHGHRTPTTITRVAAKLERATMNSDAAEAEVYSVADVPWTMYYNNSFALHTSYWHDGFGGTRSHGCINLAPNDARALYHWSSPDVPPGWIAVYGDADNPGSLVRVRSHQVPEPAFRGYARRMREEPVQLSAN